MPNTYIHNYRQIYKHTFTHWVDRAKHTDTFVGYSKSLPSKLQPFYIQTDTYIYTQLVDGKKHQQLYFLFFSPFMSPETNFSTYEK